MRRRKTHVVEVDRVSTVSVTLRESQSPRREKASRVKEASQKIVRQRPRRCVLSVQIERERTYVASSADRFPPQVESLLVRQVPRIALS